MALNSKRDLKSFQPSEYLDFYSMSNSDTKKDIEVA